MSWDPNQGQPSSGQDPYSGYGTPSNPYGAPPPQNPYGAPPPQNPYGGTPNPYAAPVPGAPGYQPAPGYGYAAPTPPVGEAVQQLPNQYINVATHPSANTFAVETSKANWPMVWVQLLGYVVAIVLIGMISSLIFNAVLGAATRSGTVFGALSALTVTTSIGTALLNLIFVPLFFFAGVGIQYLLAKAFSGQGTFLGQAYGTLLYQVPLGLLGAVLGLVLGLIPVIGGLVGVAIFVYAVVLNIFMIMAVHRLSGGKATGVVLIPYGAAVLLVFLCAIAFASFFYELLRSAGGR